MGCQPCGHSGGFPTRRSTSPPCSWSLLHLCCLGRWSMAQTTCCANWTSGCHVGPEASQPVPPARMSAASADSFWTQTMRKRHKPQARTKGSLAATLSLIWHLLVLLGIGPTWGQYKKFTKSFQHPRSSVPLYPPTPTYALFRPSLQLGAKTSTIQALPWGAHRPGPAGHKKDKIYVCRTPKKK